MDYDVPRAIVTTRAGRSFEAAVHNLSPLGAFLSTEEVLPFREAVQLELSGVLVSGEVLLAAEVPAGLVIGFVPISAEAEARLEELSRATSVVGVEPLEELDLADLALDLGPPTDTAPGHEAADPSTTPSLEALPGLDPLLLFAAARDDGLDDLEGSILSASVDLPFVPPAPSSPSRPAAPVGPRLVAPAAPVQRPPPERAERPSPERLGGPRRPASGGPRPSGSQPPAPVPVAVPAPVPVAVPAPVPVPVAPAAEAVDDLPTLESDGATVLFASAEAYRRHLDEHLARGGLVVRAAPLSIGTQRMLRLQVPGRQPYTISARVIFSDGGKLGFMVDSFALHRVKLAELG